MFKRLKKAWKLSKMPDAIYVEKSVLTPEQIRNMDLTTGTIQPVQGDGNAAFFGEPTPEEELEFQREEQGTKKWYDRLKNLV